MPAAIQAGFNAVFRNFKTFARQEFSLDFRGPKIRNFQNDPFVKGAFGVAVKTGEFFHFGEERLVDARA